MFINYELKIKLGGVSTSVKDNEFNVKLNKILFYYYS